MTAMCVIQECPCYRTCDLRADAERCATWRANSKDRVRACDNRACVAARRARKLDEGEPLPEANYVRRVRENASRMPDFYRAAYIRSRAVSAWIWKRIGRENERS